MSPRSRMRVLDPDQLGDHVDRLFRSAWALCGNRHDAEDLVQETCALVLTRPRFLRHDSDLGYLLRVLRNTHIDHLRRSDRRVAETQLEEHDADPSAFDLRRPDLAFEVGELFEAIAGLPTDAREAIVAVDVAGLSYREAAVALGLTEPALTSRLHRGRRRVVSSLSTEPVERAS